MVTAALLLLSSLFAPTAATSAPAISTAFRFEAVVGDRAFACTEKYEGIGVTRSTIAATDFRLYASRFRLVRADGTEVPVSLTQDGLWQHESVALLDFEDATGTCVNGTPELRTVVEGSVPAGDYRGLRFDIGVPFELNHRDATLAASPLNLTRLFWSWNGGYKFARIDLRTTGQPQGWMIHLGSTGCAPAEQPTAPAVSCQHPNVVVVDFPEFDATSDIIRFDLAALLRDANVDVNEPETARGCMSGRTDPECTPLLAALGLADDGVTPQRVVTLRRATTANRQR